MNLEKLSHLPIKSILDIGAQIGDFAVLCKNTWPDSKIICIEANKECDLYLKSLGVEYYLEVLSDSVKEVDFYTHIGSAVHTGNSYYKENTKFFTTGQYVILKKTTTTLDLLLKDRSFDFIKIDTQGSEIDIIKGGLSICKSANYILLEVALTEYNIGAPQYDDVVSFMDSIGYEISDILEEHYDETTKTQIDILFKRK
jgi:FkbM family methyltransferase